MKKRLCTLLAAVMAALSLLTPASAASAPGFLPIEVSGREVVQRYTLAQAEGPLHLAAYDETGRMVALTVHTTVADGQEHTIRLTASRDVARVQLFRIGENFAPLAEAETLYHRLGSVIHAGDDPTTALFLYRDELDENFSGTMNEAEVLPGDLVEYFANDDGSITANVTHYDLVNITAVGKKISMNWNGIALSVPRADFAGFDYEKGDYVLVSLNEDYTAVLDSYKADIVSGEVKAFKGSKFKIGSEFYQNISGTEIGLKQTVTVALNRAGQIVRVLEQSGEGTIPARPNPGIPGNPGNPGSSEESTPILAQLLDEHYIFFVEDDGTETYTYTVLTDGDEVDLSFLAPLDLEEGDFFTYTFDKYRNAHFVEKLSP